MSMFGPGPRQYEKGDCVRTPLKKAGRVVGYYVEREPQHDDAYWEDGFGWTTGGDEYMQNVYRIEVNGSEGSEVQPWPEELLEPATVLDIIAS